MGEDAREASSSPAHADRPREFSTDIPARLERLPWGRFHTLVVVALGITWILDGLEVTLAGSVAGALKESPALGFDDRDVGIAGSAYLLGAVAGALFFGWLTDRLGRKKLFFTTIAVYLTATALTGLSWTGLELLALSLPHRRRDRRRVYGDQLHHPGAGAGPLSRLHRSRDQRQLLDRRRARRGRGDRASRSAHHRSRDRMARLLSHRRDARPRRLPHADVDPRKSALAGATRAGGGGRGRRRRHRGEVSRRRI